MLPFEGNSRYCVESYTVRDDLFFRGRETGTVVSSQHKKTSFTRKKMSRGRSLHIENLGSVGGRGSLLGSKGDSKEGAS